ncbi:sugar transferase [uncultured Flavobacterium sp.]|uniref:sugar transferase n=1 Tax=uncultured Flavobacterium sp. TaxID=165435 RepID=UPI00262B2F5B|nr:sugar transferase [uncultured Flavobacterium sp.]
MLFKQVRIGKNGVSFVLYKFRSIPKKGVKPTVFGRILRRTKLDELPQLYNLIRGDMTLIGPRPDVPGYADQLKGDDRIILQVKPGITGLASLKYRNEEQLLAKQEDSLMYNDTVIWPDKVRINIWYIHNRTLKLDLIILACTFFNLPLNVEALIRKTEYRMKK